VREAALHRSLAPKVIRHMPDRGKGDKNPMAKFIVQHTYKMKPEAFWTSMQEMLTNPTVATPMATEIIKTGARPIVTYDTFAHGHTDGFSCVWEAETAEQVDAALKVMGCDTMLHNDIQMTDQFEWIPFIETLLKEREPA
jgi:hypothetical protein